ncbi:hypothetical protein F5Y16DRAFT_380271 [Xylariaceae sp. FL0255]|nr:hypothetical protein F5Y16DRAFT_380271 [Xylariaceae sp. FL0255]
MTTPATKDCCGGKNAGDCACGECFPCLPSYLLGDNLANNKHMTAKQATCSCGKNSALQCSCAKAATENDTSGDRCQCGKRRAGQCTCGNQQSATNPNETDFTTKK